MGWGGGGAGERDERTHPPCWVYLKSRFFRFFCSILRSIFMVHSLIRTQW